VVIIESTHFTADVQDLLSDDEYAKFQRYLVGQPKAGDVITGTGGLRKIRWAAQGRGKSGGVRVIYYHLTAESQIRLLVIYRKGEKDDLTPAEKVVLRKLNEAWKR
jgi:mRNA-degrading endonuclease RelE of RelBE toxin-antitoxin system